MYVLTTDCQLQSQGTPLHAYSSNDQVTPVSKSCSVVSVCPSRINLSVWHKRLGHVSFTTFRKLGCFKHLHSTTSDLCTVCPLAKQSRLSFPFSNTTTTSCFHSLHADVWGPYRVTTHDGRRYFLTLVDDYSRYTWLISLNSKFEVIVASRKSLLMICNVYSASIKILRSDNGCEFFNFKNE